jgi:hypothetical protein
LFDAVIGLNVWGWVVEINPGYLIGGLGIMDEGGEINNGGAIGGGIG